MIAGYAEQYDLELSDQQLRAEANEWSINRGGRAGRVAWQYFQDLAGRLGNGWSSSCTQTARHSYVSNRAANVRFAGADGPSAAHYYATGTSDEETLDFFSPLRPGEVEHFR